MSFKNLYTVLRRRRSLFLALHQLEFAMKGSGGSNTWRKIEINYFQIERERFQILRKRHGKVIFSLLFFSLANNDCSILPCFVISPISYINKKYFSADMGSVLGTVEVCVVRDFRRYQTGDVSKTYVLQLLEWICAYILILKPKLVQTDDFCLPLKKYWWACDNHARDAYYTYQGFIVLFYCFTWAQAILQIDLYMPGPGSIALQR